MAAKLTNQRAERLIAYVRKARRAQVEIEARHYGITEPHRYNLPELRETTIAAIRRAVT
jgi:hypothetical protein